VTPNTHRKVWWRCSANSEHIWLVSTNGRMWMPNLRQPNGGSYKQSCGYQSGFGQRMGL
jgi:hypothetical protein